MFMHASSSTRGGSTELMASKETADEAAATDEHLHQIYNEIHVRIAIVFIKQPYITLI